MINFRRTSIMDKVYEKVHFAGETPPAESAFSHDVAAASAAAATVRRNHCDERTVGEKRSICRGHHPPSGGAERPEFSGAGGSGGAAGHRGGRRGDPGAGHHRRRGEGLRGGGRHRRDEHPHQGRGRGLRQEGQRRIPSAGDAAHPHHRRCQRLCTGRWLRAEHELRHSHLRRHRRVRSAGGGLGITPGFGGTQRLAVWLAPVWPSS